MVRCGRPEGRGTVGGTEGSERSIHPPRLNLNEWSTHYRNPYGELETLGVKGEPNLSLVLRTQCPNTTPHLFDCGRFLDHDPTPKVLRGERDPLLLPVFRVSRIRERSVCHY